MPPESPVAMPRQNFGAPFQDTQAPGAGPSGRAPLWRVLAFSPAMVATFALLWIMVGWFSDMGISGVEGTLLTLIAFNFFWITFTLCTVILGVYSLARLNRSRRSQTTVMQTAENNANKEALSVALLMPIHNEVPWYVLGNARSMLEELRAHGGQHKYAMFILSDTRDDAIAAQEQASVEALRSMLSPGIALYYRRRVMNTDRKVGNITDWVSRWGGAWQAMLVLDADSLMTGKAILQLSDALAHDPGAGLIQSFPQLIGAQSVFARAQQFANGVYGAAMAEGMARWCGQEGNYWGHNAIIRTSAFATSAGLPKLRDLRGQEKLIMSHDFVEASLLRRAGWGVRFLPQIRGSYEESPPTLIDHIQRDRRWCQGNLQHLNLLWSVGFKPLSRFHLFHGAIGYLLSPIWFALLVMWALIGRSEDASVLTYFSESSPLMPTWPEMSEARHVLIIVLMYGVLLAPKLLGVLALPLTGAKVNDFGGVWRLFGAFLSEVILSVLYAPILMVQQMIAVFRTLLGLQKGWQPQVRNGGSYGLLTLIITHALETISGAALWAGIFAGVISPWLIPIAISMVLAVPLSAISGVHLGPRQSRKIKGHADFADPPISQAARHYRQELKLYLEGGRDFAAPAE